MTVTKVKPSSSKPIGVSFCYKCHKVRWAYRLKYVAARPSIMSMPYELTALGLQGQSSSNNTEIIIRIPTINTESSRMLTNIVPSDGDGIIIIDNPISIAPSNNTKYS